MPTTASSALCPNATAMSPNFSPGDRIRLIALPSYLKTADSMPALRSPNLLQIGEEGVILNRKPGGYWSIRFAAGAFLLESQYLEPV